MPLHIGQIILVLLVSFVLPLLVGFPATRLLLPERLRPYEALLMPVVGISLTITLASFANTYVMPLGKFTWPLVGGAILADVAVYLRTGARGPRWSPDWMDTGLAAGLMLLMCVAGVLPLVRLGYVTPIGANGDAEYYLPLAEVVARSRINGPIVEAANPVIEYLNRPDARGGAGWGFSYFEALIDTATGLPPLVTFPIVMAAISSLQLASAWALGRSVGLTRNQTFLAAVLLAFHPLTRWIEYFGYAGHVVSFALIPGGIAATLAALDERRRGPTIFAAFIIAGLALSYYSAAIPVLAAALVAPVLGRVLWGHNRC